MEYEDVEKYINNYNYDYYNGCDNYCFYEQHIADCFGVGINGI